MVRFCIKSLTILSLLLLINADVLAGPPVQEMQNATMLILSITPDKKGGHGSGFLINNKHVVTNWHVVECVNKGCEVWVVVDVDTKHRGRVKWHSAIKDIAVIETEAEIKRPVAEILSSEHIEVTDTVFASGFPYDATDLLDLRSLLTVKISKGSLTAKVSSRDGVKLHQTDVPINPGNSGGPLFNEQGQVVGIVTAKAMTIAITVNPEERRISTQRIPSAAGIGWAVQSDELITFLKSNGVKFKLASPYFFNTKNLRILLISLSAILVITAVIFFLHKREKAKSERPQDNGLKLKPVLVGIDGVLKGVRVEFDNLPVNIGRDPSVSNLITKMDDDTISRRHCTVRYDPKDRVFYIIDHSRNGTFLVNGTRLSNKVEFPLKANDRFYLSRPNNLFEVRLER